MLNEQFSSHIWNFGRKIIEFYQIFGILCGAVQFTLTFQDGSCPKPTVSMFRRTLGTEASPRLTTKANSDLVDRWLTSQMAKNATIGAAYQPTTISTDSNGAHEIDGGLNSAQATEGVTASGVSNVNGTSGSHGGGFDGSGSGQQSNSMYRVVNIINDNELLGIQVVAQYEKMKQPVATAWVENFNVAFPITKICVPSIRFHR